MRTLWRDEDGAWRTTLRGRGVLADPRINKGTAFDDGERHDLGLTALIPRPTSPWTTRSRACTSSTGGSPMTSPAMSP